MRVLSVYVCSVCEHWKPVWVGEENQPPAQPLTGRAAARRAGRLRHERTLLRIHRRGGGGRAPGRGGGGRLLLLLLVCARLSGGLSDGCRFRWGLKVMPVFLPQASQPRSRISPSPLHDIT
jgi:hypothetical protein